ncbi:MAG: Uncharacterized protein SCO3165, partial [uncultured Chloroflexia bacterium]
MHPTTARVAAALRDAGFSAEIRTFEADTRTAQQAADALGVSLGAIVKSLCFMADDAPVMVLVSGANRGDPQKIRQVLGAARVVRANADDVRAATGYAIGGVPPLGHAKPMRIIIDPDLLQYDVLWAAAGTPNSVFRTTPSE